MTLRSIINFLLFQGVWFLALLFEQQAVIPIIAILILMLYLSPQKKHDLALISFGLLISLCFEYLMVLTGFLTFSSYPFPFWFVLLWCALLLTVNTSMQFLDRTPWYMSLLLCAVFAPGSYIAGANFGALEITMAKWQFWLVYGSAWSVMFNMIRLLNKKIKKCLFTTDQT